MHFSAFLVLTIPVLGAFAVPYPANGRNDWNGWNPNSAHASRSCSSSSSVSTAKTGSVSAVPHTTATTTKAPITTLSSSSTTSRFSSVTTPRVSSSTTISSSSGTSKPSPSTTSHASSSSVTTTTVSSSSSAPITGPTSAYGLISARSASPIHLQPWSAAGLRFYIGGGTASYCPESIKNTGSCPPGNVTAFLGTCDMDVLVPGGQQLYVTPGGEIGYTQAHSMSMPSGSNACPFAYSKPADSQFAYISPDPSRAFGATGFMACPTDNGYYQVFANVKNAVVPKGKASDCLGFDAIVSDYAGGFAAWQYT